MCIPLCVHECIHNILICQSAFQQAIFHTLINAGAWLSRTVPATENQFLSLHPSMLVCVSVMLHTPQSWMAPDAILSYSVCREGDKNKKISQLIHLPARKSHYTADEFKDCLRWKGTVFMARQSCVPSLLVSCGWKTKDMPTLQPNCYWTHPYLNTSWFYIYLNICF